MEDVQDPIHCNYYDVPLFRKQTCVQVTWLFIICVYNPQRLNRVCLL